MNNLARWAPLALSLLRVFAGLLFLEHGAMKLFHFPIAQPGAPEHLPPLIMVAAIMELVGGGLVAIGLFTRPIAFLLSGEMAAAYFIAHFPHGFWPAVNMGETAILYCFIFFYLTFVGPGSISVDAMMRRRA
jgi:putative oxidoreductase